MSVRRNVDQRQSLSAAIREGNEVRDPVAAFGCPVGFSTPVQEPFTGSPQQKAVNLWLIEPMDCSPKALVPAQWWYKGGVTHSGWKGAGPRRSLALVGVLGAHCPDPGAIFPLSCVAPMSPSPSIFRCLCRTELDVSGKLKPNLVVFRSRISRNVVEV